MLWKLRTNERHGYDLETKQARLRSVVQSHLEDLYKDRLRIMPVDRHIFPHNTAIDHLESDGSLETKLEWCLEVRTAIQASMAQALSRGITTNQDIRTYMTQDDSTSPEAPRPEPHASQTAEGP